MAPEVKLARELHGENQEKKLSWAHIPRCHQSPEHLPGHIKAHMESAQDLLNIFKADGNVHRKEWVERVVPLYFSGIVRNTKREVESFLRQGLPFEATRLVDFASGEQLKSHAGKTILKTQ